LLGLEVMPAAVAAAAAVDQLESFGCLVAAQAAVAVAFVRVDCLTVAW